MKNITETIKKLIAENGIVILQEEQRLKALLADFHPAEKRLRYLLELSLRAEIPKKLIALLNENSSFPELQMRAIKRSFKEEYSLESRATKLIFDCWVEVVKKEKPIQIRPPIKKRKITEENFTVTDIDGNVYKTININNKIWMVENLRTTRYQNGDLIGTTASFNEDINIESNPKHQWAYEGDKTKVRKNGRLYSWHTLNDPRCIAPEGWHVATNDEWAELKEYFNYNGLNINELPNELLRRKHRYFGDIVPLVSVMLCHKKRDDFLTKFIN